MADPPSWDGEKTIVITCRFVLEINDYYYSWSDRHDAIHDVILEIH